MLTRCSTSRCAKKCEVGRTSHVRSGHKCADKANNHERVVAVVANVVDDLVFREEAREWKHSAERKRRDNPSGESDWHELAQTTHIFFHVKRVMRCAVAD